MATRKKSKKTATNSQSKSRRRRRTAEQMIADLEAEIERVKQRAVARELKESQAVKKTISVVRGIDKALEFAAEENNTSLRHALADARKPLAEYLTSQGMKLPKARVPRGRRPA